MSDFTVQLSQWLPRKELKSILKPFKKGEYEIRQKGLLSAVFIKDRRKKKEYPKDMPVHDMTLDRFITTFIGRKRDGIGIFKTVMMTRII